MIQYSYGGPGFLQSLKLDSYQGKGTLTYLLTALGHHVLKGGIDVEFSTYQDQKAYSGKTFLSADGANADGTITTYTDLRRYGYLTGVGRTDVVTQDGLTAKSKRQVIGGFIQDSWSILDKVTLNLGLRYDSVNLKGDDGVTRIALNDQISPRVGLV